MDLCHCPKPNPTPHIHKDGSKGDLFCTVCGLWFVQKYWDEDSRVREVKKRAAAKEPWVVKQPVQARPDPYAPCACGSGKKVKFCCGTALNQLHGHLEKAIAEAKA